MADGQRVAKHALVPRSEPPALHPRSVTGQSLQTLNDLGERAVPVRGNADRELVALARGEAIEPPDEMPFIRLVDRRLVTNPGSIGMPYGRPGGNWALLHNGQVSLRPTKATSTVWSLRSPATLPCQAPIRTMSSVAEVRAGVAGAVQDADDEDDGTLVEGVAIEHCVRESPQSGPSQAGEPV
ncbi:MAG TPA: hypothetical protein VFJ12_14875, partial [Segeticoccus sp.]|nr:hypothetical protein [Segeticoccus sp.]